MFPPNTIFSPFGFRDCINVTLGGGGQFLVLPPDAVFSPLGLGDGVDITLVEWGSIARINMGVLAILVVDGHVTSSRSYIDVNNALL